MTLNQMIRRNHFRLDRYVYDEKSLERGGKPFPSICHKVKVYWTAIPMILLCNARNAMATQLVERNPKLFCLTEHHLVSGSQWITGKAPSVVG